MDILQVAIKQAGYLDRKDAIKNVHFSLRKGEITGLIGPNGAGKSTAIKTIVGIIPQLTGTIEFTIKPYRFAYIPEQPVFYDELTLWEHFEVVAAAYELEQAAFLHKSRNLLEIFQLTENKHHFPGTFSKGMQQKTMLIISLLIEPNVYIIDEPFVGLDPRAILDLLQILNKEKIRGASILLSTHQLDLAERICDSVILMANGQIVTQGSLAEIRAECSLPTASLFDCFNVILERPL